MKRIIRKSVLAALRAYARWNHLSIVVADHAEFGGIRVSGANAVIQNCTLSGGNDGILLDHTVSAIVHDNIITNSGRYGIRFNC